MVWANPFHELLLTSGDDCTRSNSASRIRTRTLTPAERDARARTNNLLTGHPNDLCARHKQIFGDMSGLQPISYSLPYCILLPSLLPTGMLPFGSRPRDGGSDRQGEYGRITLLSGPGRMQVARGTGVAASPAAGDCAPSARRAFVAGKVR
jgi:hypothetical protein